MSLLLTFEAGSTLHELGSFISGYRVDVHGVWVSSRGSGKWSEVSSVEVTEVVSWWSPGCFQQLTLPPSIVVSDCEVGPFFERLRFVDVERDLVDEGGVEDGSKVVNGESGLVGEGYSCERCLFFESGDRCICVFFG